jgi:hypothetical protein
MKEIEDARLILNERFMDIVISDFEGIFTTLLKEQSRKCGVDFRG